MAIYKLGDIADIKRGSSPRPIHEWLRPQGLPWAKISDLNGNLIAQTKEFVDSAWERKGLIGNRGDLFITNSASPGIPFMQEADTAIAYHDGFLFINPKKEIILKKFLLYKLIIDRPKLVKMGNGAVFINLSSEILKNWIVDIPTLEEQQAIIDIIEQKEQLFLKFSNCVRIDTVEHAKNDMKNLIDIIEPLENFKNNLSIYKNQIVQLENLLFSIIAKSENNDHSLKNIISISNTKVSSLECDVVGVGYEGFVEKRGNISEISKKVNKNEFCVGLISQNIPIAFNFEESARGISTAYYVFKSNDLSVYSWYGYMKLKNQWKNFVKPTSRQGQGLEWEMFLDSSAPALGKENWQKYQQLFDSIAALTKSVNYFIKKIKKISDELIKLHII